MTYHIEPLTSAHDRKSFDCGEPELNSFLEKFARQNQDLNIGRTFVLVPDDGSSRVVGFYTLSAGSVAFKIVPDDLRKHYPKYPIPVAHLGRLGICRSVQGRRLGEALLFDALCRVLEMAENLGIAAIEVIAKNGLAKAFYEKYGFRPLLDDQLHLYLPIKTAARLSAE